MTPVMEKTARVRFEEAVLKLLAQSPGLSFAEVVRELTKQGLDEGAIKSAIWQLHSDGSIELTPDWKLRSMQP